jgi:hypothetical protein
MMPGRQQGAATRRRSPWALRLPNSAILGWRGPSEAPPKLDRLILPRLDLPSYGSASNVGPLTRSTDRCGQCVPQLESAKMQIAVPLVA